MKNEFGEINFLKVSKKFVVHASPTVFKPLWVNSATDSVFQIHHGFIPSWCGLCTNIRIFGIEFCKRNLWALKDNHKIFRPAALIEAPSCDYWMHHSWLLRHRCSDEIYWLLTHQQRALKLPANIDPNTSLESRKIEFSRPHSSHRQIKFCSDIFFH